MQHPGCNWKILCNLEGNLKTFAKLVVVVLLSVWAFSAHAAEWTPFQLSLVKPVQLFPEETKVEGLRLNLIYGVNKDVTGLDLGIVNEVTGTTKGVQAAYMLGGNISHDLYGAQVVYGFGGVNVASGEANGLQIAGIFGGVNWVEEFNGVQLSGVLGGINKAANLTGLQVTVAFGGINKASDVSGMQIAGILGGLNFADDVSGVQMAGTFAGVNVSDNLSGAQLSGLFGINIAKDVSGVQIGSLYNQADAMEGLQLGLVNLCNKMKGVQVGLINIITESNIPFFPVINANF